MESIEIIYQMKLGKPFIIRDIDPLFYACDYLNSNLSFIMDKEKFIKSLNRGTISEYRTASNY